MYDLAIARKQAMTQGNAGQGDRHVGWARTMLGWWWPE
jgi:hypothetical protein